MKINTAYMGEMTIDPSTIISFEHGIPGFEDEKKFVRLPISEESIFQILQSVKTEELAFIITSPFTVIQNYNFELDEPTVLSLEVKNESEIAVFTIVTLKETLADSTTNLKAPIVINTTNNKAKQVILNNEEYAIRHKMNFESVKG